MDTQEQRTEELVTALVMRLVEIIEETEASGYQGHGRVPRFFDEIRTFVRVLMSAMELANQSNQPTKEG